MKKAIVTKELLADIKSGKTEVMVDPAIKASAPDIQEKEGAWVVKYLAMEVGGSLILDSGKYYLTTNDRYESIVSPPLNDRPDKELLEKIKSGEISVKATPPAIKMYPKLKDPEAASPFSEKLPEDIGLMRRGDVCYLVPRERREIPEGVMEVVARSWSPGKKFVSPRKSLWDLREELLLVFPELEKEYDEASAIVNSAGCSGCSKGSQTRKIRAAVEAIMRRDPSRDIPEDLTLALALPEYPRSATKAAGLPRYERLPGRGASKVRPTCLDCCRKHLGAAIVLFQESENYPDHFWLGIGNLDQVEAESLADHPEFAREVRGIRLRMMADRSYGPDLMGLFPKIDMLASNGKKAPEGV